MSIIDLPSDFVIAMEQAFRILAWQENLPSKEIPPVWMWTLDWEVESWFEKVDEERNGGDSSFRDKKSEVKDDNVYVDRFK